jgi:hypothetical protein
MFPYKMLFRFLSAMVLFATGGFAAGHDLPLPFDSAPPEVAAPAPVTEPVDTTTTTLPAVDESTTTTTTAPDAPVVEPVPVPVPIDPTAIDPAPAAPSTPTPVKPAKPVGVPAEPADTPPAAPVDGDAPAVCAAAADTKACGPVAPDADNSHQTRVERCQDWWNSLAQAFEQNGRPEWATRARAIAGRCDAMITRWEEAQKRWEERRKAKGDHNTDGRPDSGRGFRRDGRDDRNGTKEAEAAKVARHSEGRHSGGSTPLLQGHTLTARRGPGPTATVRGLVTSG